MDTLNHHLPIEILSKEFEEFITYEEAIEYCSLLEIVGKRNWRLPTIEELDIFDCFEYNHDLEEYMYWAKSDNPTESDSVSTYYFTIEDSVDVYKTSMCYCRPVRDLKNDPSILDSIEVAPIEYHEILHWDEARLYCFSLTIDGTVGWRMPTCDELDELFLSDYDFHRLIYWSSECNETHAWTKWFDHGITDLNDKNDDGLAIAIVPVRDI
jgi:hypothetical protein